MLNLTNYTFNDTLSKEKTYVNGIEFFLLNFADYFPYTFLAVFSTISGIIGNFLIMGAIICTKELHTVSNMFVFNLAIADLFISGLVDSFTAVGVLWNKKFFDDRPGLCDFIASSCLVFCETSLMSIGCLALNRYVKICHNHLYAKLFTRNRTLIYCAICWLIGCLIDIPNFTGWSRHAFDLDTLNCMWDRLASESYSIFFPLSSIVVPCLIILFFYVRIFMFAVKSKSKIKGKKGDRLKHSLKIAKGLFASYMLFTLCWLPYGLACMIDFRNIMPRTVHMYTMLFAHMNSAFNPILYAFSNPLFQRGYLNLFRTITCANRNNHQAKSFEINSVALNTKINAQRVITITGDQSEHFGNFAPH